jgi:lysozyme family protein
VSATINSIIEGVLDVEGEKFTNDPNDSGGPTKWGVTLAALSEYLGRPAIIAELQALTREQAHALYQRKYVEKPGYGQLVGISLPIAAELIDTGVNCGPAIATIFLQRCLNALNLNGTKYPDIPVDGECGPGSRAALSAYLSWRGSQGESVLLKALNCMQGERYIELAEKRAADEGFVYGWLKQRIAI